MSDDGNFLARWSCRKRNTSPDTREQLNRENDGSDVASQASATSESSGETKPPFDAASLPSIESIDAGSDIRAFLAVGVPSDLTRAALRRVWLTDSKIRNFIGLSENSWDFNAPGAMAGFGPIDKEEAARVLTRLLGESDVTDVAANSPTVPSRTDNVDVSASEREPVVKIHTVSSSSSPHSLDDQGPLGPTNTSDDVTQRKKAHDASQSESTELRQPRGHGSALPK